MKHIFTIFLCLLVISLANAQVPDKISYQGLLTTSSGTPVQDGSYNLKFDFYNLPSAGTLRHTETHNAVAVERGVFSLILGPLPAIFSESLYVEVTALSGPGISGPLTFTPRSELTSAPYALVADTANFARNVPPSQWITNGSNIYYNSGNVGLGTTTPNSKLNINGGDDNSGNVVPELQIDAPNFPVIRVNATGGPGKNDAGYEAMNTDRRFRFGINTFDKFYIYDVTALQDRFTIDPYGNVGIGTTIPRSALEVFSNQSFSVYNLPSSATLGYGTVGTGYNLIRTGVDSWTANSDGFNNGGGAIYGTVVNGLNFVTVPSTGASHQTFTDAQIVAHIRMKINPDGSIGIGTTTPDANAKLDVNGYAFAKAPVVVYDSAAGSGTSFDITWRNDVRVDNNIVEKQSNNSEFMLKKVGWYRVSLFLFFITPDYAQYAINIFKNGIWEKSVCVFERTSGAWWQANGSVIVQSSGSDLFKINGYSTSSFSVNPPKYLNQLSIEYLGAE
jgi:hypothetical protein